MEDISRELTLIIENIYKSFGLDALSSKLFSILFLEPKEVSIDELSKKTGYSLSSISNKMRFIEKVGVAERIKKPGTKKVYYYVEKDIIKMHIRKMEIFSDKMIAPLKDKVPKIIKRNKNKDLDAEKENKLKIIETFYCQILKIEKVMDKFKKELEMI